MRLFVAVDLPAAIRASIADCVGRLRDDLRRACLEHAFKWVAMSNLHITLRFLGSVGEESAARVIEAMQQPLPGRRVDLTLARLGTFPPQGRPRVLHYGCVAGAEALARMRAEVDARLRPLCAWEEERRPFAPHLTLARGREGGAFDLRAFREIVDRAACPELPFTVDGVTLFSSRTLSSGPEYTVRARAALRSD